MKQASAQLLRAAFAVVFSLLVQNQLAAAVTLPLNWRWSNPLPHGNNIIDMAVNNGLWVQVAERGQIYTSFDLNTWIPQRSNTTNALRSVTFFNGATAIVGENGIILFGNSTNNSFQVISLGTTDWLEGVAASPSLLVAVGDNAAIYTSSNGTNWQRQSPPFTDWLRSVAYGNPNGSGMFVAVGEAGLVTTSTDGQSWQKRAAFTSQDLNKVAWVGDQFIAVGNAGIAFSSSNGTSWQPLSTGATNTLNTVAGTTASKLIAGDSEVRLFEGRGPWANEFGTAKLLPPPVWTYLSAAWDGSSYLLGGRTGMLVEGFKTNENSQTFWLPTHESPREWLWEVDRFPSVYIAVGDRATVLTSLNGVQWQSEFVPGTSLDTVLLGVGGRTNLAVAVGSGGTILYSVEDFRDVVSTNANNTPVTNRVSTLGIEWTRVANSPTTADLQGITSSSALYVASGAEGTILTSPNATTWTRRTTPVRTFLSSVESFSNGFVAVGANGTALSSPDGTAWTQRSTGTTNWIFRVRHLNGQLFAVGQNGTILTSGNGTSWTRRNSGTTRWLNDIFFTESTYFAAGNQGTLLMSTNGESWTDIGTITPKSLYGVSGFRGQLLLVGIEGIVLRARVAPFQNPVTFLDFPKRPNQNAFVFGGEINQRFTVDRSTDLINWTTGPELEIFDDSGAQLFLDNNSNAPSVQFFRTTLKP